MLGGRLLNAQAAAHVRALQKHASVRWCGRTPGIAFASFVQADSMSAAELQSAGPTGTKKAKKRRLDEACLEQHPEHSRNVIQSWITQGKVAINGRTITKAGSPVPADAQIVITAEIPKYVCRAGLKLEAALDQFGVDVRGLRVLDSGLSTGGFADCLLQRGAAHVVGVDVGYGQVAERVRVDKRLTIIERTNLRYITLKQMPGRQLVQLATLDLSFISVLKVLPAVCGVLDPDGALIVLIKPQFEAGKSEVSSGGIVRDPKIHQKVIESVTAGIVAAGFTASGCMESPLKGAAGGNTEFLAHFQRCGDAQPSAADAEESSLGLAGAGVSLWRPSAKKASYGVIDSMNSCIGSSHKGASS